MNRLSRPGAVRPVAIALFVALTAIALDANCAARMRFSRPNRSPADNNPPTNGSINVTHSPERLLLGNTRQLTFAGKRAGEGYFSADGRRLIFQSERDPANPFYQIYLMDLRSGEASRVSPGTGKTTCGWIHPDGSRVLFASTHEDPASRKKQEEEFELRKSPQPRRYSWDFDDRYDIFEKDLVSARLKNLTRTPGYDAEGSWSPDGSRIVFASNRQAYDHPLSPEERAVFERDKSYFMDIYSMNSDGSDVRRLTNAPGYDGGPFFSPDGSRIVWRHFSEDGATAEIHLMNADGTDPHPITHLSAMSWAPFFHPSGDYIVFATNLHGFDNFELYMVDTAGQRDPVRMTTTAGFDGLPSFSPDGRTLAWSSARTPSKETQIFLAEWNDAEARRLLGLRIYPTSPPLTKGREIVPLLRKEGRGEVETSSAIQAADLRAHAAHLASPELEGRQTGTQGERLAAEYVAAHFAKLNLIPAGDNGTFYQTFEFTAGVSLGPNNRLEARSDGSSSPRMYSVDEDWRPLGFSPVGSFPSAPVVFAGYGISAPSAALHGAPGTASHPSAAPSHGSIAEYDSFAHLDVRDKWVLAFRFLPEDVSPEVRQHLNRFAGLRHKAMVARDRGARGLLVVSGPSSKVKEDLIKLSFDTSAGAGSLPVISISDRLADDLLRPSGKSLQELQTALDNGAPAGGFLLGEVQLQAEIDIQKEKRTGRNVLARLQGGPKPSPEVVIVGAHMDHLGRGLGGDSLAQDNERGSVHPGADDNASGVAALLEIAEDLASLKSAQGAAFKHDGLFAAWSGEEIGLLGSSRFVQAIATCVPKSPPSPLCERGARGDLAAGEAIPKRHVAAYLNMDMVGRLDAAVVLQGYGSSATWPYIVERAAAPIGLSIHTQNESYLPTDATSFYVKGVPILNAFTGAHSDYHTPRDTPDRLNYDGMERIARFMSAAASQLMRRDEPPDYRSMEKPASGSARTGLRAYLGTIPDYAQIDAKGVRLSGVVHGGPAEQAGIQGGDTIIEVAGRKIDNIYDYTYALEALRIGVPVAIVVLRAETRLLLTVTPQSRE